MWASVVGGGTVYTKIVKKMIRNAFAGLNRRDINVVTGTLSRRAEHYFIGEHALSGTRRTPESIDRWYKRLFGIFREIHFTLHRIDVVGPPWKTLVTVDWTETNRGTDGISGSNTGFHAIELRWGRVRRVAIYTDTLVLSKTLERLTAAGNPHAPAAPIVDP